MSFLPQALLQFLNIGVASDSQIRLSQVHKTHTLSPVNWDRRKRRYICVVNALCEVVYTHYNSVWVGKWCTKLIM